jgi:hypothetical protein
MLCFKCFMHFRFMFQVFHLNVANRSRMLHMLQDYVSSVLDVLCLKCFIWMLHMLPWFYTHVSNVCFKCSRCFGLMLQVFHLDVAKVDLDVAYIAMAIHASVCFKYFICFRCMLHVFHLDVSKVDLREHMLQWRHRLANSSLPQHACCCWGRHCGSLCGPLRPTDASTSRAGD